MNSPHYYTYKVKFLGELGEDGGGLTREFWSLLSKEIKASIFYGEGSRCVVRHDPLLLQVI